MIDALKHQRTQHQRAQDAGDLVADPHDADAPRRALDRAENTDVGIRCGLQQREPGTDDEESRERKRVVPLRRVGAKHVTAHCHHEQAERHALLHAGAFENPGRGERKKKVRHVEGGGDEERLRVGVEVEGELYESDQRSVDPGHEPEYEKQHTDRDDGGDVPAVGRRQRSVRHDFNTPRLLLILQYFRA